MNVARSRGGAESPGVVPVAARVRLGVVGFINTLPLIDGLDGLADLHLQQSVPSLLIDQLLAGEVDVALCSSIDYQRSPEPLVLVPAGMLGCDGPTLTVRLYSSTPIETIKRVHCDTDSHTSIALMQIILHENYGLRPVLVEYDAREHVAENRPEQWPQTMLLIGDKVVTDSPPAVRYPHQLDLGEQWRAMTGLPFVFALWMARADADSHLVRAAAIALDRQRRHNAMRIDSIVHQRAVARNWPADLAFDYLHHKLRYEVSDRAAAGLSQFYDMAASLELIESNQPLRWFGGSTDQTASHSTSLRAGG